MGIAPVPIKKAKCGVAGLLNFGEQNATANGMHRTGRQEHTVAGLRLEAVQAIEYFAGCQDVANLLFVYPRPQAGINPTAAIRIDDKPSFGLAALTRPKPGDGLLIRMNLN